MRKLLRDSDLSVRSSTALALIGRGDKTAVPVLIALLAELPFDRVGEVEDTLTTLAGDDAPTERVGSDKDSRVAAVAAWTAWWSKEEKNVDLAKLDGSRAE